MRIVSLASAIFLLIFSSFVRAAFAQSWGLEGGRASRADLVQLRADLAEIRELNKRLPELDYPNRKDTFRDDVNREKERRIQRFHVDEVRPVILRIVNNPAAACAVADSIISAPIFHFETKLLEVRRETSSSLEGWKNQARTSRNRRCREEALDECVKTGRYQAILEYQSSKDPEDILTTVVQATGSWKSDALQQCANYELKFESKGGWRDNFGGVEDMITSFDAVVEGSIKIKYKIENQADYFFQGRNESEINPWLSSLKNCNITDSKFITLEVNCPGFGRHPNEYTAGAEILALDLIHPVYELIDFRDIVTKEVSEDRLKLQFTPGIIWTDFLLTLRYPGEARSYKRHFTRDVFMQRFLISHHLINPPSAALIFDLRATGNYPVLFKGTVTGKGEAPQYDVQFATDTTTFELIHKPKPKPYPPRP